MGLTATAKSVFAIGTTIAASTLSEYIADTFVPVANVEDMGGAGSSAEILEAKTVDQVYTRKIKGSRDNGTMELVVIRDATDPGYIALIAAEKTENAYNFKMETNDKPATGASPKGSRWFFKAIVASAVTSFDGADDLVKTTFSLAISGAMLEVAPSAT